MRSPNRAAVARRPSSTSRPRRDARSANDERALASVPDAPTPHGDVVLVVCEQLLEAPTSNGSGSGAAAAPPRAACARVRSSLDHRVEDQRAASRFCGRARLRQERRPSRPGSRSPRSRRAPRCARSGSTCACCVTIQQRLGAHLEVRVVEQPLDRPCHRARRRLVEQQRTACAAHSGTACAAGRGRPGGRRGRAPARTGRVRRGSRWASPPHSAATQQVGGRAIEHRRARALGVHPVLVDAVAQVLDVLPLRDRTPQPASRRAAAG